MARKQLSGAQKRKIAKARALSGVSVMPRAPTASDLASLTGVAREQNRNYRDWKQGRITSETYLVAVRGLSALTAAYNSVELEKRNQIDERLASSLEALEGGQAGAPLLPSPSLASPVPLTAPALEGELMPREFVDDGNDLPSGEAGT